MRRVPTIALRCSSLNGIVELSSIMAPQSCPTCGTEHSERLAVTSSIAEVDYYRCPACCHVWTVDKVTHELVTHVTPEAPKPLKTAV